MRPPDFIIGKKDSPYLRRWWVIPRNRFFNIYLHQILRDDDDRALHNHPWWNCSIILSGGYTEMVGDLQGKVARIKERKVGRLVFRGTKRPHRLIVSNRPAGKTWTLFITGPRIAEWGFFCPKGWMHWKKYTDPNDSGRVGKGCEE